MPQCLFMNNDTWIPQTDGRRVWAINSRTGQTLHYTNSSNSPVVSVVALGEEVAITTQDGRTRAWNPRNDNSRTFL